MQREYGDYRFIDKIAQGAMGEVLLVENESGQKFALKTLKKETSESSENFTRFKREIELSKELKNDHIVQVVDFDLKAEPPWMVMEYMKNGTLDERLSRENSLEPLEVLKIAIDISKALSTIHILNMVHRDIKPGNILIAEDGNYKLTDLGLAGVTSAARKSGSENLTISQTALGTPYYISPEQAENAAGVDIRADIYSLGATLYYCLTGRRAHEGNSSIHVMMKHMNESVENPLNVKKGLPGNIVAVVMKMLERNPKDRYQNPAGLLDDLMKIKDYDAPPEDLIASQMSLLMPASNNKTGLLMFLSFLAIVCLAVYGFYKSSLEPPDINDKFYKKDRLKVKEIKVEKTADFLLSKAAAVEKFLVEYPTEIEAGRMQLAAETAHVLANQKVFHITVVKAGNLSTARTFAFRVYINGNLKFEHESSGKKKFLNPEARIVAHWEPGTKIKIELEEFDWQNEMMYQAIIPNYFSLRGLSGQKVYRVNGEREKFFQDGLLKLSYSIDEIPEEAWQAFEDYIYPGEKW